MKNEDKAAKVSMGIAVSVIVLSILLIYLAGGYLMKEIIIFIAGGVLGLFAGGFLFLIFFGKKKMQEEILEDLNHNIYTPLNGLCGLIYLAREHADHKEKVMESLDKMEEAVRMLKDKTGLCFQKIREEEKIKGKEEAERNVEKFGIVPMHFLIAEDNEMNAEILTAILRLENHTVTWAKNGQEAVRFFESSKEKEYQVILMDLCMPVMNGYKAAKIIRKLEREDAKTVPILACSANIFPEDKEKAKKSGMDGFIEKPIYIEQLKKEIIRVVGI